MAIAPPQANLTKLSPTRGPMAYKLAAVVLSYVVQSIEIRSEELALPPRALAPPPLTLAPPPLPVPPLPSSTSAQNRMRMI